MSAHAGHRSADRYSERHADPAFGDIEPGHSRTAHGILAFLEGDLDAFSEWFKGVRQTNKDTQER